MEQNDGCGAHFTEAVVKDGGGAKSNVIAAAEQCQNLLDLPIEIHETIYSYLSEATTFRVLPQVCKQLRALIASDEFVRGRIGHEAACLISRRLHGGFPQTKAETAAERQLVSNLLKGCALFPVLPERAAERDHLFQAGGVAAFKAIVDDAVRHHVPPSLFEEVGATTVIGCRVTISGVKSKPHLNGTHGFIKVEDTKKRGRWGVQLDGTDAVISFHKSNLVQEVRVASPSANTNFQSYCLTRPLPETFMKQPGTFDLARGQESFPISVNTRLIVDSSSQGVYISALPDAAVPWMSMLENYCCTDGGMQHPRYSEFQRLVTNRTRVKLCGPEMNGKCGTIVGQNGGYPDDLVFTVDLDDVPTKVDVLLHNCLRLKPHEFRFQYTAGPRPAAYKLQVFKSGAPGGLGYGVRTLENIRKGDFVCTYWGTRHRQHDYDAPARNFTFTIFIDVVQGGVRLHYSAMGDIGVNALVIGNVARWINCSKDAPTLEPRMIHIDGCEHPVIAFFALEDIECGEDLTWSYSSTSPSINSDGSTNKFYYVLRKSHVGQPDQAAVEMVRDASTGNQTVARWAFGNPPWETVAEEVKVQDVDAGTNDAGAGAGASSTNVPLTGPWPKRTHANVYEEEYWEPFPVFNG